MKYIDSEKLIYEIENKWRELADKNVKAGGNKYDGEISAYLSVKNLITSLQQEHPKNYFFCQLSGTIPKCSDCLRNHGNSPYHAKDIDTWMRPTIRGTKQCSDYINSEQPEVELDEEIKDKYSRDTSTLKTRELYAKLARHFFNLGLNARNK